MKILAEKNSTLKQGHIVGWFRREIIFKLLHVCTFTCTPSQYICVIACVSSVSLQRLTLLHANSNQCLDMPSEEDKMVPTLRDCNGSRSQQWLLRNMTLNVWSLTSPTQPFYSHPNQSWLSTHTHQVALNHTHHMPLPAVAWPVDTKTSRQQQFIFHRVSSYSLPQVWERLHLILRRWYMMSRSFWDHVKSELGEGCVSSVHGEHWYHSHCGCTAVRCASTVLRRLLISCRTN